MNYTGVFPLLFVFEPATIDWPLLPNVPSVTPENNLLSVSAEAEHPNFVNPPKGEMKRGGSGPLLLYGAESEALETRSQMRAAPSSLWRRRHASRALGAEHGPLRCDPGFEIAPECD